MIFGFRVLFGFRGSGKHTYLATRNIYHGDFPPHHPFTGYSWYGIDGLTDKSHKLSVNTDYVRNTKDCMKVPVMSDDLTSDDMPLVFEWCILNMDIIVKYSKSY